MVADTRNNIKHTLDWLLICIGVISLISFIAIIVLFGKETDFKRMLDEV